ncbi:MAG: NAD(P)/FAD-dependent oxidoreductase [Clostridium sp.]
MRNVDLAIIGGGPAGLAAACSAYENGVKNILILERDEHLGGILNQCIHNGFGLHTFKEELTGPEYAHKFIKKIKEYKIEYKLKTTAIDITQEKIITALNSEDGVLEIHAKAIILAMGCRERPRGAINIPGDRCSGIFTAGTAQAFVNLYGYLPGKEVVILGSGDIGLIMARRLTFEGSKVKCVVELMNYSNGLKRNIVQCLEDYNIPLLLSHTITEIHGKERLEGITISKVDEAKIPIKGSEEYITCDTLLLSVGLIPDNSLSLKAGVSISPITGGAIVDESMKTNINGVFSCGNVLHVHDLVDHVTEESYKAGLSASKYINGEITTSKGVSISAKEKIRYTVPSSVCPNNLTSFLEVRFRVSAQLKNATIAVYFDDEKVLEKKKAVLLPAEMECLKIPLKLFEEHPNIKNITISTEEG